MKRFISYFFVNSFIVSVLFMYGSLLFNDILNEDAAIKSSKSLIAMSAVGILVFSVVFLSYTGIYFVKSRGREMGVYLTLGMTTRDLSRMVILESSVVSMLSALLGVFSGLLFSRLFYLALGRVLALEKDIYFINYKTFLLSVGVFAAIFLFNAVFVSIFIRKLSIVEITKSSKTSGISNQSPIIGIIAFIVLSFSLWFLYAIVNGFNFVKDIIRDYPIATNIVVMLSILVSLFFVIGSVVSSVRYILQKFPAVYNRNILLLSGLSHRFLSYRVSLYCVSMLIALAVFFIGNGMSFYNYTDMTFDYKLPYDIMVERRGKMNETSNEELAGIINENGGESEKIESFYYLDSGSYRELHERDNLFVSFNMPSYLVKLSDYNRLSAQNITLEDDELLIAYNQEGLAAEKTNFDTTLVVEPLAAAAKRSENLRTENLSKNDFEQQLPEGGYIKFTSNKTSQVFSPIVNSYGVIEFQSVMMNVVSDEVYERLKGSQDNEITLINLSGSGYDNIFEGIISLLKQKNVAAGFLSDENEDVWDIYAFDYGSKDEIKNLRPISKEERFEISFRANAFLLFALSFLGILFLVSSFIVLYYKLLSDVNEEASQIDLLKKIGITAEECRKYLKKHLGIIFFAPLLFGGSIGLYMVNNFVSFTTLRGALMLRVTLMFAVVSLVNVALYFSLKKKFFEEIGI